MKVSIIGIGRVGSTLGYLLASEKSIDQLVFVDEIKSLSEGIALDISNAYPESSLRIFSGNLSAANNSDIVIISASAPTDQKIKIRMELLGANKPVIEKIFSTLVFNKKTIVIMVTNPVEPLCAYAASISDLPPENIIGFGNSLDTARLKSILSKKTKLPSSKIDINVIGEHGENMIPVFSSARIAGKPIELYNLDTNKITNLLKDEGRKVRQLTGGVRFGAARQLFELVQSVLKGKNKIIPVCIYVKKNSHYGVEDVFISLPAIISSKGVSDIVEIPISAAENEKITALSQSLREIQKNM